MNAMIMAAGKGEPGFWRSTASLPESDSTGTYWRDMAPGVAC